MSENRRVSMDGNIEPKDMSRYLRETKRRCPTCDKSNMFVRQQEEATLMLECPNCDLTEHLPIGLEIAWNNVAKPAAPAPMNSGAKGGKKK